MGTKCQGKVESDGHEVAFFELTRLPGHGGTILRWVSVDGFDRQYGGGKDLGAGAFASRRAHVIVSLGEAASPAERAAIERIVTGL